MRLQLISEAVERERNHQEKKRELRDNYCVNLTAREPRGELLEEESMFQTQGRDREAVAQT